MRKKLRSLLLRSSFGQVPNIEALTVMKSIKGALTSAERQKLGNLIAQAAGSSEWLLLAAKNHLCGIHTPPVQCSAKDFFFFFFGDGFLDSISNPSHIHIDICDCMLFAHWKFWNFKFQIWKFESHIDTTCCRFRNSRAEYQVGSLCRLLVAKIWINSGTKSVQSSVEKHRWKRQSPTQPISSRFEDGLTEERQNEHHEEIGTDAKDPIHQTVATHTCSGRKWRSGKLNFFAIDCRRNPFSLCFYQRTFVSWQLSLLAHTTKKQTPHLQHLWLTTLEKATFLSAGVLKCFESYFQNLTVKERCVLMKRTMDVLLSRRKNLSMSDTAANLLLQKCRSKLSEHDLRVIDAKIGAIEKNHTPDQSDVPWVNWKVTLRLKTILEFCVERLEKSANFRDGRM